MSITYPLLFLPIGVEQNISFHSLCFIGKEGSSISGNDFLKYHGNIKLLVAEFSMIKIEGLFVIQSKSAITDITGLSFLASRILLALFSLISVSSLLSLSVLEYLILCLLCS